MHKHKQIQFTLPTGNNGVGRAKLERWKQAALKVMRDPKLFNAWARQVLDAEADRILKNK